MFPLCQSITFRVHLSSAASFAACESPAVRWTDEQTARLTASYCIVQYYHHQQRCAATPRQPAGNEGNEIRRNTMMQLSKNVIRKYLHRYMRSVEERTNSSDARMLDHRRFERSGNTICSLTFDFHSISVEPRQFGRRLPSIGAANQLHLHAGRCCEMTRRMDAGRVRCHCKRGKKTQ